MHFYLDDLTTTCLPVPGVCVILYADDILLTAPSVCGLDALVKTCEFELNKLSQHTHVNHVVYEQDPAIMLSVHLCLYQLVQSSHG